MRITSKVRDWLNAGFINQSQAQQILNYESNRSSTGVITGFYVLATLIISLGVISVIAFNWENIPDVVKLGVDFAVLIGLAVAAYIYFDKHNLKFEILELFFILLCMASIGLISQIYNLNSPPYVALLLWSGMTFLSVLFSKKTFNWFIWLGVLLCGISLFINEKYFLDHKHIEVLVVSMFMVLASVALDARKYSSNDGYKIAISAWMILGLLGSILLLEFYPIGYFKDVPRIETLYITVPALLSLTAVALVWRSDSFVGVQKIIASLIILIVLTALLLNVSAITFEFLPAIQTVCILILSAVLAASLQNKYLFNMFLGLVIFRSLIFYFEALGGLATTGMGLIIAGVIILYATVMWKRHGNKLLQKIEGWTNAAK